MRWTVIIGATAIALAGCGGGSAQPGRHATPAQLAYVRKLVPTARDVRCLPERGTKTDCTVSFPEGLIRCQLDVSRGDQTYEEVNQCWADGKRSHALRARFLPVR